MLRTEIKEQVNNLIQINIDASKGYRDAASAVADADLQKVFNEFSREREHFSEQLSLHLKSHGNEAEDSGSVKATLHRTWLTFKADVTSNNETTVLDECIYGEEAALETYEEAITSADYPKEFRDVIKRQHYRVTEAIRQLKEWKNVFDKAEAQS